MIEECARENADDFGSREIKSDGLGGYEYQSKTRAQPSLNYITRSPGQYVPETCSTHYVVNPAGVVVDAGKSGDC